MSYDISIIRPELRDSDIHFLTAGLSKLQLRKLRKALQALHSLELMATNIYKFQISPDSTALNVSLISAMANEMTHFQDFQIALYSLGFKPSVLRFFWQFVGIFFGFASRLLGKRAVLKVGIWTETRATSHYSQLLKDLDWPQGLRNTVEKNAADEQGHIEHWQAVLQELS